MRDTWASQTVTYGLLAIFVALVAIPLFWMVTTAIKTNKELYEDFSYFPHRPTLENFTRVVVREGLLTNIRNSFTVATVTTLITVIVSALAAFSIVRYRYRGREWIGRLILFKLILTYLTFTIPFCTWMLMGYFRGMPVELEEQAMVDGCTKLGAMLRILLPLSAPGLVASAIFSWRGTSFCWRWSLPWTSRP
jgi:multiple sugar transport system permease protein